MCLLNLKTIKAFLLCCIIILALCNLFDIGAVCLTFFKVPQKVKAVLLVSFAMDILLIFFLMTGLHGVWTDDTLKLKRFIAGLLLFFFGKITLSKCIVHFDRADVEQIVQFWYQLSVVISGLSFVSAIPYCMKLLEEAKPGEVAV